MASEIVVLPTRTHVTSDRSAAARMQEKRAVFGSSTMSIDEFELRLLQTVCPEVHVLSPFEERVLMLETIRELAPTTPRLSAFCSSYGIVNQFAATLVACRRSGLHGQVIEQALPLLSDDVRDRLSPVATWLTSFEGRCARRRCMDLGLARLHVASTLQSQGVALRWVQEVRKITFRQLVDFRFDQLAWMDALAAAVSSTTEVVIELPFRPSARGGYFRATERLLDRLEKQGDSALSVDLQDPANGPAFGAHLLECLTDASSRAQQEQDLNLSNKDVRVVQSVDPENEYRDVARIVRTWIEEGLAQERIAIVACDIDAHSRGFIEALHAFGVNAHLSRTQRLADVSCLRWVLSGVRGASEGWSIAGLHSFFASKYALHLPGLWSLESQNEVLTAIREWPTYRSAEALINDHLPATAKEIVKKIADATSDAASLQQFASRMRELFRWLNLRKCVTPPVRDMEAHLIQCADSFAEEILSAVGRDLTALSEFEHLLESLEKDRWGLHSSFVFSKEDLLWLLQVAASERRIAYSDPRTQAVRLFGVRDVYGLEFDAVVLTGLREGEFPLSTTDDSLISNFDRTELFQAFEAGGRWRGSSGFTDCKDKYPLWFALCLSAASKKIALTYSASNQDHRATAASTLLSETLMAFRQAGVQYREERHTPCLIQELEHARGIEEVRASCVHAHVLWSAGIKENNLGIEPIWTRVAIERSRRSQAQSGESLDAFGGLCGTSESALRLGTVNYPLSPSALEDMARCPFFYFAKNRLGLTAQRELGMDVDMRDAGMFAHQCFEAIIRSWMERGFYPARPELEEDAESVGLQIIEQLLSSPDPDPIELLHKRRTATKVLSLACNLYAECDGYSPIGVEIQFGPRATWPSLELRGADGSSIWIRGRMDLVESKTNAFRVSDLKTKKHDALADLLKRDALCVTSLQLPLYAAALNQCRGNAFIEARFLSIKDEKPTVAVHKQSPGEDEVNEKTAYSEQVLVDNVQRLHRQLVKGEYPISPIQGACEFCEYASLCRIEETKS